MLYTNNNTNVMRIVRLTLVTISTLVLSSIHSTAFAEHDGSFCSNTANIALKACRFDVKDDFWLAKANCSNISDHEERVECKEEAKEERAEASEECFDVREARHEVCDLLGEARYEPEIDPANFVNPLEIGNTVAPNPYFILTPGFTRIYEDGDETITVTNTTDTIEILGVTCIVVRDIVEEDGVVIEDTVDWHAQDIYGNVWYFGEIAQNFEKGILTDLDGSFKAGEEGAAPGIVMKAMSQVGDAYRQEWALSEAEDLGEVLSITASETSPAASCDGTCIQTRDFTPLEPGSEENKFYAPGVGVIVELNTNDPEERGELVDYFYAPLP